MLELLTSRFYQWWPLIFVSIPVLAFLALALRKGWIPNIESRWGRIEWVRASVGGVTEAESEGEENRQHGTENAVHSHDFSALTRRFEQNSLEDLEKLGVSQSVLMSLLSEEFQGHVGYFDYDLEDYAMPVKARFIVHLDKIGTHLIIKRVLPCTTDEAKLSSWSNILTLYRRAMRMAYREDPDRLILYQDTADVVIRLHEQIRSRLVSYYRQFEHLEVDPTIRATALTGNSSLAEVHSPNLPEKERSLVLEEQDKATDISFRILESGLACSEATTAAQDYSFDLINSTAAKAALVQSFERSLQYIHKVLLAYPPTS